MNKNQNQKRSRGRGNGRRGPSRGNNFESNGPEVKVRGSAQQVLDKYLQLARDAQSGGDRVSAESYLQYAEHYYRIINADLQSSSQSSSQKQHATPRGPATAHEHISEGETVADLAQAASANSDDKSGSKPRSRQHGGKGNPRSGAKGRAQNSAKDADQQGVKNSTKAGEKDEAKKSKQGTAKSEEAATA